LREIELIHTAYKEELETVRGEAQKKIDYLRAEIEKKEHTIDRLENRIDRILDK
jgi:peptidoglycan hydrolase CwlO-like protein